MLVSATPMAAGVARIALHQHKEGNPGIPLKPIYMHPPVFTAPRFPDAGSNNK
jgi:hypothetical protein